MTDFLDEKRNEISSRIAELRPVVEEYQRLEAAAAALDGAVTSRPSTAPTAAPSPRRRGRPRGSASASAKSTPTGSSNRGGRPKGSGTRATQAESLIIANPGITLLELAKKMGISRTYLYRVLPGLELERRIRRRQGGWYPYG